MVAPPSQKWLGGRLLPFRTLPPAAASEVATTKPRLCTVEGAFPLQGSLAALDSAVTLEQFVTFAAGHRPEPADYSLSAREVDACPEALAAPPGQMAISQATWNPWQGFS